MRTYIFSIFLCAGLSAAAPQTQQDAKPPATPSTLTPATLDKEKWSECDEYISRYPCKVTINLGSEKIKAAEGRGPLMPHAHWDVQVKPFEHFRGTEPLGKAAVLLVSSSPFLSCTMSAVPANPARDLSTNIGSLLTAVAGIGAPPLTAQAKMGATKAKTPGLQPFFNRLRALSESADDFETDVQTAYSNFVGALKQDWKYSFADDTAATVAINDLRGKAQGFLNNLDALPQLQRALDILSTEIAAYEADHPGLPDAGELNDGVKDVKAHLEELKAYAAGSADKRKQAQQYVDFLTALPTTELTRQVLPMTYFSNKQVTETVTCKDAISTNPAFDNIVFIAYYEPLPHFDISVGAIASLLGGRQPTTATAPFTPAQAAACEGVTGCGPSTLLEYKVRSAYQFIPTVLAEWRWANFHCPWAHNGASWHPFGYVCSIGVAGGPAINPNNGGPAAEVFGGLSIGIQRFSILIGAHDGRYQEYGGGFYAGETFPPGTSVSPLTVYHWAAHPAFGITYRIPLR